MDKGTKPETAVTRATRNFRAFRRAFAEENVAILECWDTTVCKPVAALCAVNRKEAEGKIEFVPFAIMIDGDPYERLAPPDPKRGFDGLD